MSRDLGREQREVAGRLADHARRCGSLCERDLQVERVALPTRRRGELARGRAERRVIREREHARPCGDALRLRSGGPVAALVRERGHQQGGLRNDVRRQAAGAERGRGEGSLVISTCLADLPGIRGDDRYKLPCLHGRTEIAASRRIRDLRAERVLPAERP